ncbi:MAG: MMPL family transporter [Methanomassiliicoccales archaeon]|nr:MAG: MMPL family transporter [Methanomassiliicoccales archaeon]
MFNRLGNVIIKHHKMIIIFWAIALLVSIPAMAMVNDVVVYQETELVDGEYESIKAQKIIDESFPRTDANGTLMIVVRTDNISSPYTRDFLLSLESRLTTSQDLEYLTGVTTPYSVQRMVLLAAIPQVGTGLWAAENEINGTLLVMYGVPAMFLEEWSSAVAGGATPSEADVQAYSMTYLALNQMMLGQDPQMKGMALAYYAQLANEWNLTASNISLVSDPQARAVHCINVAVSETVVTLGLPEQKAALLGSLLVAFNFSNFNNQTAVHNFTVSTFAMMSRINDLQFLEEVYRLGPEYSGPEVLGLANTIISTGTFETYPVPVPSDVFAGMVSPDGETSLVILTFSIDEEYTLDDGTKPLMESVATIRGIVKDVKATSSADIRTYVTGSAAISADMEKAAAGDLSLIEPITIGIVIVLMGVLFRSVLAQFVPLGAAGIAIGISQALVFVIGSTVANIHYSVLTLLFTVLMGVGVDYSIFIMTRYREERVKGHDRPTAVHTAVTWAGESIVTSGTTVIIAFFAMTISSFSMMKTMGMILGMAIVVALLIALTLIPSLLMLIGNRVFWPTTGKRWKKFVENFNAKKAAGNRGYFHNAAHFAVDHAKVILVVAALVTVPAAYIYTTAETSFDFIGGMPAVESTDGLKAMSQDFGEGLIMPTQVVIDDITLFNNDGTIDLASWNSLNNMSIAIAANSEVQMVSGPTSPNGQPVNDYLSYNSMTDEERSAFQKSVSEFIGTDGSTVLLEVVLKDQPMSKASVDFITELRGQVSEIKQAEVALASTEIYVGGSTAMMGDLSENMNKEFNNMELIVVVGIFLVLMLVLGSLLLPLFAIISILMSIMWSFALTVLVFGELSAVPILWMVPMILFIMLMGIGMDYNVFILTRIREEAQKGKDNRTAIVDAVEWTGGIITALAIIMGGAFGSMMLSSMAMMQEFGFALFCAIIFDAMIVRTYIVPAAMTVMGKWAWYAPGRLRRVGRQDVKEKVNE